MIKKSICICLLIIIFVSGCTGTEQVKEKETIITQAIERLSDASEYTRMKAISELVKLSQESNDVIPELEKALKHEDALIRAGALDTIGKINSDINVDDSSLVELLDDKEIEVRLAAARAIGLTRKDAREVLPVILEGLRHSDFKIRVKALQSLMQFGPVICRDIPEIIPELIDMFEDTDSLVVLSAGSAIWQFGDVAIPHLTEAVQSESPDIQQEAVFALRSLKKQATDAIPALLEAVEDADPEMQFEIAVTVSHINPGDAEALLPYLISGLETGCAEKDKVKVSVATSAFARIGPPGVEAAPLLIESMDWVDEYGSLGVVYALMQMSDEYLEMCIDHLIAGLDSEDKMIRIISALHLGVIGPSASKALPRLNKLSQTEQEARVLNVVSESIEMIEGDD